MDPSRLVTLDDVPALTELARLNREFLAPWDPVRDESHFTEVGQRTSVQNALAGWSRGTHLPHVILDESGGVAGRINLSDIVRGPFLSGHLGYWLGAEHTGRGLATRAVRHVIEVAFGELSLHRIQAATLPHNVRSQRVLERTGFTRIGMAPKYLRIAGAWQDHLLFQLIRPD